MFAIEAAGEATPEVVEAIRWMLPLLSKSAPPPTPGNLDQIARSPATTLLIARDEQGAIVGTLTLAVFRTPTGVRAWIEDVIVAEEARGKGCGEELTLAAIEVAREAGARTVDLTSRPEREAANRLYKRVGFKLRDTNLYRFELTE